jgi:hypothetical protein
MARALGAVLLVLSVAGSVWWVQAPPRGPTAYRESTETTLRKLSSRSETARLWIEQFERGRVTESATAIALDEADRGATSALSQFESYDPPRGLEPLRTEVAKLGNELTTALGDLRIAAHQDRWERAGEVADRLHTLTGQLKALSGKAEP